MGRCCEVMGNDQDGTGEEIRTGLGECIDL